MKRTRILFAALLAGALGAAAITDAQAGASLARTARAAKVELRSTSLGRILVNASGFTLYRFTIDPRNKDMCVMVHECAQLWPPLTSSAHPVAGPGVSSSLLSTIKLPSGARQVTYAGHPLYLYAPAGERGETAYVGVTQFGGTWLALNSAGHSVK